MNLRLTPIVILQVGLVGIAFAATASAQVVRFRPKVGEALEVWRLTHDPAVRDYHNYHNTQCWSPDGRHLAFTRYAADEREYGADRAAEIHLFDLGEQRDIMVERGLNPRWANQNPWLLYNRLRPDEGARNDRGVQVMKLDVASGQRTLIGHGIGRPTHSFLCFPSGRDNSGPYDNDAKGSPDGTKIAFVSTYDLQNGPAAGIVEGSTAEEIRVDSTDGFPAAGQRSYSQGQPAWKRDGATVFAEWTYEQGVPVQYRRGSGGFSKQGDRWVAAK